MKTILVTGGAGFIGTNFIRHALMERTDWTIVNLDVLTYAGNPANFDDLSDEAKRRHTLVRADICDRDAVSALFDAHDFDGVIHFAAESHVDRSIVGPRAFIETNVNGTFTLLEAALNHWRRGRVEDFRFVHISTDEVYGSLGPEGFFTETTAYDPSSPYSASKAASDHVAKSFYRTYGLPVLVTNCSNNYGPYQFPEKLIPLILLNILEEKPLPVYGDGLNVRDWLYVIDHCEAIVKVFDEGRPGESYNIGGNAEAKNIDIVRLLCRIMDRRLGRSGNQASERLIRFVEDRPGHDRRYAIDAGKIKRELGWAPSYAFEDAIEQTVTWYLDHMDWVNSVKSGDYLRWVEQNYQSRKGIES
jgi:dTDP-glucose 4,6-dehydratase